MLKSQLGIVAMVSFLTCTHFISTTCTTKNESPMSIQLSRGVFHDDVTVTVAMPRQSVCANGPQWSPPQVAEVWQSGMKNA